MIRLRNTPTALLKADVKAMLQKYQFYCKEHNEWGITWNNPLGKGINNQFELERNGEVVFDHCTGLMWQKSGAGAPLTYAYAEGNVRAMNEQKFAGFHDWRLPTLEEAMSLMKNESAKGFYVDPIFDRLQGHIWTSDTAIEAEILSYWVVIYQLGYCNARHINDCHHVRLVR